MPSSAQPAATASFSTRQRVLFGDARRMSDLADESVQLVVTSPPYWQLKDYGAPGQIGFDQSYADYVASLNAVWAECYRVLSAGCRLCVNIGDQFARAAHYGRYKVIPIREEIVRGCENLGFDYMGAVIWQKATTMNTSGGGAVMGSFPHPRNGILKIDYEFILLFKKLGQAPRVTPQQKAASVLTTQEWNTYFSGHWNFAGEKQGAGHLAMFPMELPRRLIKMFSFVGETVLDPFLGSGTTLRAAMELGRQGIGYEINREFLPAIKKRLGVDSSGLFSADVSFEENRDSDAIAPAPVAAMSQVTTSPNAQPLERQVNPKEFRFGSVIESGDLTKPKEKGHRVRQILAPDRLRLEDGGEVRLLGIAPIAEREEAALLFLKNAVLNKPVFLKFDGQMHSGDGALQAYVYLENKTFINAKLIKHGLAQAADVEHRYATRFRDYRPGAANVWLSVTN